METMRTLALCSLLLGWAAFGECGKTVKIPVTDSSYKTLLVSGQEVGAVTFGELLDQDGKPIKANDYEAGVQLDKIDVSQAPDHTSLFQIGKDLYATILTDFFPPSTHYVAKLKWGSGFFLSVSSLTPVDWSQWGGIWLPCSGYTLPRADGVEVLNGEEYETNARRVDEATTLEELRAGFESDQYYYGYADVVNFMRYFGKYPFANNLSLPVVTIEDVKAHFKPYRYGYITSLKVSEGGSYSVSKYMTMGRASHEFGYVLPDKKTVILTDDHGSGGGIFRFVAATAGDFTAGKLYALKVNQTSPTGGDAAPGADGSSGARFSVSWVLLGSANNSDLAAKAASTSFSDIFEVGSGNKTTGKCAGSGFKSVNTATGFECLKLKVGKATEAAFFETRRYAAMLGATVEWSKAEGIAYDAKTGSLYIAMSSVRYSMEDNGRKGGADVRYDAGGRNQIRVKYNPCGCIFKMALNPKAYSTTGSLESVLCGVPLPEADAAGNYCSDAGIAGPDNLDVVNGQLIIAEDSEGYHVHNHLWAYDLTTGALTRVSSVPAPGAYSEAEFTSSYAYRLNNRTYLVTNINNWDFNGGVPGRVGYFGPWTLAADDKLEFKVASGSSSGSAAPTPATRRSYRRSAMHRAQQQEQQQGVADAVRSLRAAARSRGWPEHDADEQVDL